MELIKKIALALTIVGAINWGLIGVLDFNLVTALFKSTMISNIIYITIGICALISVSYYFEKKLTHE